MSTPAPEFNAWEHLQDVWRKVHNRRVREHFRDLNPGDDWSNWQANLDFPRHALYVACYMDDNDTADMETIRTLLFWVVLGQAQALQVPVYGIPIPSFQEARKFRPQIQLYFMEDLGDVDEDYSPVTGEINVRIMDESSDSLSEANLNNYATKIRTLFAASGGFVWQKGRVMCTYTDSDRGYKFQLLCRSKTEGRRVIEQVLDIQNHAPDWAKMNVSENESPSDRYPAIPGTARILGRNRRKPRQRPVADVRFKYASMHIHGLPNPIILVDRTGIFRNPIVEA